MTWAGRCPGWSRNPGPNRSRPACRCGSAKEFLDAHAEGLRLRHDTLHPVIDRAGQKLTAAFKELDPAEITDPEGEGAEALEKAEAYFHAQRARPEPTFAKPSSTLALRPTTTCSRR